MILKQNKELRNIPVVIISTDGQSKTISKMMKLGAAGYLTKPVQAFEFAQMIDRVKKETTKKK